MIRFGDVAIDCQRHAIWHGNLHHRWQASKRPWHPKRRTVRFMLMKHLLLSGGMPLRRLADLLYDDAPNGGPDDIRKAVQITINQLRPAMKKLRLKLHKDRRGGDMVYWIKPLHVGG